MSTQTEQRPLVERLREGCILNPKRRVFGDVGDVTSPSDRSGPHRQWIPVTEKLPEIDNDRDGYSEWVLAYDGTIECACYDPASGMWATSNEYLLHVTHWMPLPPPPVQESQEDN